MPLHISQSHVLTVPHRQNARSCYRTETGVIAVDGTLRAAKMGDNGLPDMLLVHTNVGGGIGCRKRQSHAASSLVHGKPRRTPEN
jgi:hypothetical protein